MRPALTHAWRRRAGWLTLALASLALGYAGTAGVSASGAAARLLRQAGAPAGMGWVPGGTFLMGSTSRLARPNERPVFAARVSGFWMDRCDVTNAQFAAFVRATGYLTTAERKPDWDTLRVQLPPGTARPDERVLVAGAMVFAGSARALPLDDWSRWWRYQPGANWRHPDGPGSTIAGKDQHPVVQVSWDDAQAYAKWVGKRLPTEAEWEYGARGGLEQADFSWGPQRGAPAGTMANIFPLQGTFPVVTARSATLVGTRPVRSYPANGYGLFDMAGNVWQWTADRYRADRFAQLAGVHVAQDPPGPPDSFDPDEPGMPSEAPKRVIRGGSFLCDDSYCGAYRPSARRGADPASPMQHIGFRLVRSGAD